MLDVAPDASRKEIDAAWRRLRSLHHPDRSGDVAPFQHIQTAYEQAREAIHE